MARLPWTAAVIAALLPAAAAGGQRGAGMPRPREVVRVAVVARQADDWAAAGIARGTLSLLAQLGPVWPANAAAAQRLVPTEAQASTGQLAEAGRRLRCRFVAFLELHGPRKERPNLPRVDNPREVEHGAGEVVAELVDVASGSRQQVIANGRLHELPGLVAMALAGTMGLKATADERARLAVPLVANEAAAEALWRGDAARKPEEQAGFYEAGLKADPASALLHNQLGAALARAGQHLQALAEFDRALELQPGYAAAQTNRGLLLAQLKRWREAEEAFQAAIRLGAKSPTPHVGLARLFDRLGAMMEAVEELERAAQADPCHVDTLMTLAESYFERYNLRAAHDMARRTLEVEPRNTAALNLIGLLYLVPHEYEEAEAVLLEALTVRPDDPETLCNLALALYGQGQAAMARGILEGVAAREPGFANAHLYLGRIHLAEKRPREAAEALQRAAELRPALGAAQRGLASARAAAAPQQGCGCLGIEAPFSSMFSANRLAGPLIPIGLLLAPHILRLTRRRRPASPRRRSAPHS